MADRPMKADGIKHWQQHASPNPSSNEECRGNRRGELLQLGMQLLAQRCHLRRRNRWRRIAPRAADLGCDGCHFGVAELPIVGWRGAGNPCLTTSA